MSELALLKMSQFVGPSENVPVCCHSENVPALSMNKLECEIFTFHGNSTAF